MNIDSPFARLIHLFRSNKDVILFIIFYIILSVSYIYHISQIAVPIYDAAVYLGNAHAWLSNSSLYQDFRPPLISWLIAGIWSFTGENWLFVSYLSPIFTMSAGFVLYILLRKHKGNLFAFSVTLLTMLNAQVFFWSTQIMTEGLSLFFLVLTLYFVKSKKEIHWIAAGVAIGLTFGSRYPIFLQAIVILIVESIVQKNHKLFTRAIVGALPIISIIILTVYFKAGRFVTAVPADTIFTYLLSPAYLVNSINIWGIAFLLVPVALIFKRTYTDKYNYVFIVWFIFSLIFWSANSGIDPHQGRFAIQFTPAVYFLAILAVENIIILSGHRISSTYFLKYLFRRK